MTDVQAELLERAVETTQNRDEWKRYALHLERDCPDPEHCFFTVGVWKARAAATQHRLDLAEAALTEMLRESRDAYSAVTTWRHTYGPEHLATVPTPARWKDLAQR